MKHFDKLFIDGKWVKSTSADIIEAVHLPAGVFNLVSGSGSVIGPMLSSHPLVDMVSFTGSTSAGIKVANDTVYGLASGVYAKNKASALKIAREIRAGQCYIQGSYFNLEAPFGGFKQSGNGREWGDQAMHEYFEIKAIIS